MSLVGRYAVMPGPGRVDVRTGPVPEPTADGAILEVEGCGICGSDVELYDGAFNGSTFPVAPGHEPFGRILRVGAGAARRWRVGEGDRVAMASTLRCGMCEGCRDRGSCGAVGPGIPNYGFRPPSDPPGWWGGFASHLYLHPRATFVPMRPEVPVPVAALYNALANGYEWVTTAGIVPGARVVVFGPGPRGLACVVAAKDAGAGATAVVGLPSDADRLAVAIALGADAAMAAPSDGDDSQGHGSLGGDPFDEALRDVLGGAVDVVIDTTPGALGVVGHAVRLVRRSGVVVLAGLKGRARMAPLPVDTMVDNQVVLKGAASKSLTSMKLALARLEGDPQSLAPLSSTAVPLDQLEEAILTVAGRTGDRGRPLHMHIRP